MSKSHPPYAPEYRRQMIELVHTGRTPGELAREYECSAQAIRNWVRQAERDEGRREDGLTSSELEKLRRFRRQIRQLREERDILAKATAWFARETGSVMPSHKDIHQSARGEQAVLIRAGVPGTIPSLGEKRTIDGTSGQARRRFPCPPD